MHDVYNRITYMGYILVEAMLFTGRRSRSSFGGLINVNVMALSVDFTSIAQYMHGYELFVGVGHAGVESVPGTRHGSKKERLCSRLSSSRESSSSIHEVARPPS